MRLQGARDPAHRCVNNQRVAKHAGERLHTNIRARCTMASAAQQQALHAVQPMWAAHSVRFWFRPELPGPMSRTPGAALAGHRRWTAWVNRGSFGYAPEPLVFAVLIYCTIYDPGALEVVRTATASPGQRRGPRMRPAAATDRSRPPTATVASPTAGGDVGRLGAVTPGTGPLPVLIWGNGQRRGADRELALR
jgi:hypothetical protein